MGVADGDGERTTAGALDELLGEVRVGIVVAVHEVVGVGAVADVAELGLDVNLSKILATWTTSFVSWKFSS